MLPEYGRHREENPHDVIFRHHGDFCCFMGIVRKYEKRHVNFRTVWYNVGEGRSEYGARTDARVFMRRTKVFRI